ncbi:phage tail terminator family protein [Acetobacterium wieringae]|uniref:phage tail terminator family protein n=1 Tax=Acetobacterium wieringae TaxID=52694 RepID=UPI00203331F9|nr:hypothetical protein [Acetobacterium wieringae]URN83974.1 hypothetical protein CHL1_003138 [Acetobacterium wieringae]
MIDQIITGIATTIAGLYPDCTVYTEPVEQGLVEPAFYIHCINVDQSDLIAGRFRQSMPFEVVYFPLNGLADIYTTIQTLTPALRLLTLPDGTKIRGIEINGKPIDGEGHIFVTYDATLYIQGPSVAKMQTIEITERIK